ncbi:Peptidase S1 domain-containing protein [Caenorhabditis elegans]|uniref:Peptidase S1 domain-containing protein n=1 Tax=Caenorhabditis elegans TaxID=6239 RepID=A0A5K1I8N1_CAEEL|nr:Peptidase S1 domain-containing protein [Caenorhabditis elegans]VWL57800.1 Peptidase S1 domain-containing protein [Caenorhabditis elegans]
MKFLSIIVFSFISIVVTVKWKSLTTDENKDRLEKCGNQDFPEKENNTDGENAPNPGNFWLAKMELDNNQADNVSVAGFFISPRHVLTSVYFIMIENGAWRTNYNDTVYFKNLEYIRNTTSAMVPEKVTKNMKVIPGNCSSGQCILRPKKAVLINVKKRYDDFSKMSLMVLIELEENVKNISVPCIPYVSANVYTNDDVFLYGHATSTKNPYSTLQFKPLKIKNLHDDGWICTDKYQAMQDRGGPLVKLYDDKVTAIGIKSTTGYNSNQYEYYFDLRKYNNEICEFSGVCTKGPVGRPSSEASSSSNQPEATTQQIVQNSSDPNSPNVNTNPSKNRNTTSNSNYIELPIDEGKIDEVNEALSYPEDSNDYFLKSMMAKNTERTVYKAMFDQFDSPEQDARGSVINEKEDDDDDEDCDDFEDDEEDVIDDEYIYRTMDFLREDL